MSSRLNNSAVGAPDEPSPGIWLADLWGLDDRRLAVLATATTALLLLWSRFAFLPSGPWEWDEMLFARGTIHFDLHAHFPQPPGFPLWLALGWLMLPLVSEPLHGLQLLSALASVLTLWPLAALGRRVAPPLVATTAAVVVLLTPGVWLHAMRGFTSTPAAFLALWAAAIAVGGLHRRRATAFTLLVTAAFLVRPILLPSLGLLWLAGALAVRPRWRILPGMAIGLLATAGATAGMLIAQGDTRRFLAAFANHAERHARGLLANPGGFADLGIVKGMGGQWPATTFLVLSFIGLVVWARRRGIRPATAWLAVWAAGVVQLVWLQDRTYSRYAVPFQMAAAPLVAGAAATVAAPPVAAGALAVLGYHMAVRAYPVVEEQHSIVMPGWAALRFGVDMAERRGLEMVIEPGLLPYASYMKDVDARHGRAWRQSVHHAPMTPGAKSYPKGSFLVITDRPERYLTTMAGRGWWWGKELSSELKPLTQHRFLWAAVLEGAPLPVTGWRPAQRDDAGETFMWGSPEALLLLPPLPPGTRVAVEAKLARGAAPLEVQVNGASAAVVPGDSRSTTIWLLPDLLEADACNTVVFSRFEGYPAAGEGSRLLALRVSGIRALGPEIPWHGPVVDARQRAHLAVEIDDLDRELVSSARFDGVHGPERFPFGIGAWTRAVGRIQAPVGPGTLTFRLWAPRPTPPMLEIWIDDQLVAGPLMLRTSPQEVTLELGRQQPAAVLASIELRCDPYHTGGLGAASGRELGVVVSSVELRPPPGRSGPAWRAEIDEASRGWRFRTLPPGVYKAEQPAGHIGVWTRPRVHLVAPIGAGMLQLTAWAPRMTPPNLEIWQGGRRLAGPLTLGNKPDTLTVLTTALDAPGELQGVELRCDPYVPALAVSSGDRRPLGVVISHIAFYPFFAEARPLPSASAASTSD